MENRKREKTNSLTHLTKILIKETMESDLTIICDRLRQLETHKYKETVIDTTEILNNIKNNLDNVGDPWNKKENDLLLSEMKVAIETIAANHGRTGGAITSRLNHLGMGVYF
ncbi:hypothetical protein LCGC14_1725870 [marine sediment metagenome]|uniref:Uncharacterized protein n=1 Tax=marine sediment metagenome TaxID=412755 RepID=A0A0F9HYS6_9ZZZZ